MREPAAARRGRRARAATACYEAIDYTPSRAAAARPNERAIVRSFMAHHQGMSLLALAYLLLDRPMQRRFEADPLFAGDAAAAAGARAAAPRRSFRTRRSSADLRRRRRERGDADARLHDAADAACPKSSCCPTAATTSWSPTPAAATAAGGTWRSRAGARTPRATAGARFCYLRDVESGEFWSTAYQPTLKQADRYEAIFSEGRGGVPPPRRRHRDAHRDQRLARGRHRAAPRAHHQPLADAARRSR